MNSILLYDNVPQRLVTTTVADIYAYDAETGEGIPHVTVDIWRTDVPTLIKSELTDSNGYLYCILLYGLTYRFVASHRDYYPGEITQTIRERTDVVILLNRLPPEEQRHVVKVYCVDNRNHRMYGVHVSIGTEERVSDKDGLTTFYLESGLYVIYFDPGVYNGRVYPTPATWEDIKVDPFSVSIEVSKDAIYTAYVEQQNVLEGPPPKPPPDIPDYWPWIVGGLFVAVGLAVAAPIIIEKAKKH